MSILEKIIDSIVTREIKTLQSFGYYWCNAQTIWTTSIFTFQLQCRMERELKPLFGDDTKEDVRKLIAHYHLKVVEKNPELKEY